MSDEGRTEVKRKWKGHSKEEVSGGRTEVKRKGRGHSKEEVSGGRTEVKRKWRGHSRGTGTYAAHIHFVLCSPMHSHPVRCSKKVNPLKTIYPSFHCHLRTNHALTDNLCQAETQVTKSPAGSQIWTEHKQQQTQPRQTVSKYIIIYLLLMRKI